VEQTKTESLQNDPAQTGGEEANVYTYIYESATLYYNTPTLTEDSILLSLTVTNAFTPIPRTIGVDGSVYDLLNSFANENKQLYGSEYFSVLYANESLPEVFLWGRVSRSGQDIYGVEYTVHEQPSTGGDGYTYSGLFYDIQDGVVSAISAFGLNSLVPLEEVEKNLSMVEEIKKDTSYFAYPVSNIGTDLEPFNREDMMFGNVDYIGMTPEKAQELFGAPTFEEFVEDGKEWMQIYQWDGLEIVFSFDSNKQFVGTESISIDGDMKGPRGIKLGDGISNVIKRFKFGEGVVEEQEELLYGGLEEAEFGIAEYENNGDAVVRYVTTLVLEENDGKEQIMLYLRFVQGELAEILLSSY
ncbi:MAG: hypothetical protein GX786_01045, partial [Clostridiales bacterium]|nr:hypothetical protein [Clostridiales bacterium]